MDNEKIIFGEQEWLDAYVKSINGSEAYEKAAKEWEGDFVFVVTPDGTGTLTDERRMYVDLWHGKCRGAYYVTPEKPAPEKVAYVFSGKYGDWLKVFDGKLDPLKGVLQRKFKVECGPKDMAKMLRAVKASQELVKCTQMEGVEYP
ncbi:MAG: SCP2 sterol-binding domain-containing protein [Candidatus Thorarchaeota archaeon]